MQAEDRGVFEKALTELFGALDKPLTEAKREAFWKGLNQMSLVEFHRCCDYLIDQLSEHEAPRTFSVSDIWSAKRAMRAPAPEPHLEPVMDPWGIAANKHLLAHLVRKVLAKQPIASHSRYIEYKNAWARDMREACENGAVPIAFQRESWADCMARAEA